MRAVVLGAMLLSLSACSLVGLADGLEQERGCRDCAELNDLDTPPECMSWRCSTQNPSDGVCVLGLLDNDLDGAPNALCVPDEVPDGGPAPDCDDMDDARGPALDERCDGVDNDCDERIDEGLAPVREVVFMDEPRAHSFARDTNVLTAAFSNTSISPAFLGMVQRGGTATVSSGFVPDATAITSVGDSFLVGYTVSAPCPRVIFGTWSPDGPPLLTPDSTASLPKITDRCPADGGAVGTPAIATLRDLTALFAFTAGPDARTACGSVPTTDVAVVLATRAAAGDGFEAPAATATVLGQTAGIGPPAVLGVEGLTFLVAYANAASEIEIRRVTIDDRATGAVSSAVMHTETGCTGGCGHVALSQVDLGGTNHLALAYRAGDCGAGRAALRTFTVSGATLMPDTSTATLVFEGDVGSVAVAGRATEADIVWAVAYADGEDVMVQRVRDDAPFAEPLLMLAGGGTSTHEPIFVAYDASLTVGAVDVVADELAAASIVCEPERPLDSM